MITAADGSTLLPDIWVEVYHHDGTAWREVKEGTSDGQGHYDIGGLASGVYRVRYYDPSGQYVPEYYADSATVDAATDVAVTAGATTSINAALDAYGHIAGTVTAWDGTTPAAHVQVTAYRYTGGSWQSVNYDYTDSAGQYDIGRLTAGTYRIGFSDYNYYNYLPEYYDNKPDIAGATDVAVALNATTSGINAALDGYGHITGKVTAADGTTSAANVQVTAYRLSGGSWQSVRSDYTDSEGLYDINGLTAGTYRVGFQDYYGNYFAEYYDNAPDVASATDIAVTLNATTSNINAALEGYGHIAGKLTAWDGTTPAANVQVTAYRYSGGSWQSVNSDYTDSAGQYDIGRLTAGTYRVGFSDYNYYNYLPEYYDNKPDVASATDVAVALNATTSGINAALDAYGHIAGAVTAWDGATPAVNVYVTAYRYSGSTWQSVRSDYTDNAGQYDINGLTAGTYRVGFSDYNYNYLPEYYDNQPDVASATDVAVVLNATTSGINAALDAYGHIAGKVTAADGMTPLANIYVTAYRYSGSSWQAVNSATTNSAGQYDIGRLTAGTYRIGFSDYNYYNYLPEYYDNKPDVASATDVAVALNATSSGINAALDAYGHIAGKVTAADGVTPAANITVTAYRYSGSAWQSVRSATTNSAGQYDINGLTAGTYRVGFSDYNYNYVPEYYDNAPDVANATDVAVALNATTSGINAALDAYGHIAGTVTAWDGTTPLANIYVTAYRYSGSSWQTVRSVYSNSAGQYDIGRLTAGTYHVGFYDPYGNYFAEYYDNVPDVASAADISVTLNHTTSGINAALDGYGHIAGRVTAADGTTPLANIYATAYRYSGSAWQSVRSVTTNSAGQYEIVGLGNGTYRVGFSDYYGNFYGEYYDNAPDLDTANDVSVTLNHTTGGINASLNAYGSILGTVTAADGVTPISGIVVTIYDLLYQSRGINNTDSDGSFLIKLPPGAYRVRFTDPQGRYQGEWYHDAANFDQARNVSVSEDASGTASESLVALSDTAGNGTGTDHSRLEHNPNTGGYLRTYPDGTKVYFKPDGAHDYTLDRLGNKTTYTYNADGAVATMTFTPAGASAPSHTWNFSYTGGKLSSITDPAGRATAFTVDGNGHLIQAAFPDGTSRQFAYDGRGLLTQQTDQRGEITSYSYDAYGRIQSTTSPQRQVFDPATGQTQVIQEVRTFTPSDTGYALINDSIVGDPANPAPAVPKSADLVDRVAYTRGGISGHTNEWGSWLDETDAVGRTTTYQRDGADNPIHQTNPDGTCVSRTYDDKGNLLSSTELDAGQCQGAGVRGQASGVRGQGPTWSYTYERRFNQIKTETDPMGRTTVYVYDYEEGRGDAGNLVRVEYPAVPPTGENGQVVTPTVRYTYNALGLKETETDQRGMVTKYVYTQGTPAEAYGQPGALFAQSVTPVPGLLTKIIEDYGDAPHLNVTTVYKEFDAQGKPMTVYGPNHGAGAGAACATCSAGGGAGGNGVETHYTYDAWSRVLTETDALGIVTKYEYDARGNLTRQTADYTADGRTGRNVVTEYTYNPNNQLLRQRTVADGIVQETSRSYDVNRKLAAATDGNGNTTTFAYDAADQLIAETDPLGHTTTYAYTARGELAAATGPDGMVTAFEYDAFGRRTAEIVDAVGLRLTTRYAYDAAGNLLTVTDPAGTATCYIYDALDRRTSEIRDCNGLRLTTTYVYDLAGNLARVGDARGVVTINAYDPLGRLVSTRRDANGLNLTTTYQYDLAGNVTRSTDERGTVTTFEYDAMNRLTRACADATGLNLCTTYTCDRLGNRLTATDPKGVVTRTETNVFGKPMRTVEDAIGLSAEIGYVYDSNLNLVAISDDNGHATRYTYDANNRLLETRYADGSAVANTYRPNGTLATRTAQDGVPATYTYDAARRLTRKSYPDGANQTFGYDAAGRRTTANQTMSGHNTALSFAYNALGDVTGSTQTVDGRAWTTGYSYDYAAGRTTTIYPSGSQVTHALDGLGRLSQVTQNAAPVASYAYDDAAGTVTLAHANGVTTVTETDPLRRITRVHTARTTAAASGQPAQAGFAMVAAISNRQASSPDQTTLADYRYGYDAAGNRTYMQRVHKPGSPTDVYQYDGLYQLTKVWYGANATDPAAITAQDKLQSYKLDTVGNRLTVQNDGVTETYQPNDGVRLTDPLNRYGQVDAAPFSYDPKGNLLADGRNTYTYDHENRQTGASGPGGVGQYIYDPLGRRVAKIVDGAATYYVYNTRYQIIEERNGSNGLLARYIYGGYIDEPLTMERGGATYTYHRDALGDVTEMTSASSTLIERYEYDAYGTPHFFDSTGNPLATSVIGNPWLFTGRQYDGESSNYYYRARMYEPGVGRFVQMDPAGYVDGMGLYTYVRNSPIRVVDPTGRVSQCCNDKQLNVLRKTVSDCIMDAVRAYEDDLRAVDHRRDECLRAANDFRDQELADIGSRLPTCLADCVTEYSYGLSDHPELVEPLITLCKLSCYVVFSNAEFFVWELWGIAVSSCAAEYAASVAYISLRLGDRKDACIKYGKSICQNF